jgi:hypothetical protein
VLAKKLSATSEKLVLVELELREVTQARQDVLTDSAQLDTASVAALSDRMVRLSVDAKTHAVALSTLEDASCSARQCRYPEELWRSSASLQGSDGHPRSIVSF